MRKASWLCCATMKRAQKHINQLRTKNSHNCLLPCKAMALLKRTLLLLSLCILLPQPAQAHPHVWITYTAKVLYDKSGITGVQFDWVFDKIFSSMALDAAHVKEKENYTPQETASLQKEAFSNLIDFNYFCFFTNDGVQYLPKAVDGFMPSMKGGVMRYVFTVYFPKPAKASEFILYDPSFYVDVGTKSHKLPSESKGSSFREEKWETDADAITVASEDSKAPKPTCTNARTTRVSDVWGEFYPVKVTCHM